MEDKQAFGLYLKGLREEKLGVSQRKLAEMAGISHSTIAKIERGDNEASDETLYKLSDIFKIDYYKLAEKQMQGSRADLLAEKIKRLNWEQVTMVTRIVDEFLKLGGSAKNN